MPLSKARMRERKKLDRAERSPEQIQADIDYSRNYGIERKSAVKGDIYFIFDGVNNAVKIGIAENPSARLVDIQTGNPNELVILKTIPGCAVADELEMQLRFSEYKLRSEWFRMEGKLKDFCIKPKSNPNKVAVIGNVKPDISCLNAFEEGNIEGIRISVTDKVVEEVKPIPLYNPQIHRAGDRVMVQKGKRLIETVIPELDADGYAVY